MTKPLQLIITCDDGGLSHGIDTAVIDLYKDGLVSAVSVMSNMPQARVGLSRYKEIPSLEVGAHLTLTEGQALTQDAQQSSLIKNGIFKSRESLFTRGLFLSNEMLQIIRIELDAQMQVFTDCGIQPAHITTHHHFHMLPKLRTIVYGLAEKYAVNWVRNSSVRGAVIPSNPLMGGSTSKKNVHDFIELDYIVLVMEWLKQSPQAMLSQLEKLDGIIELVIHPCAEIDDTYPKNIMYQPHERYQEVRFIEEFLALAQDKIDIIQVQQSN